MIRSNKKMKLNDASKSGYVQSGNFMTSCLHDQTEYTDEMPIASPDAMINEVPANAINPEQEEDIINEAKESINSINTAKLNVAADKTLNANSNRPNNRMPNSIARSGSISGGLTLDRTNKSLKNLIFYIKNAYSNSLNSPKWKNFKGLKLQVIEKIRLNNVIWRTWFEQYGNKNPKKKQRPLLCQFAITLEDQPAASARLSKLEGEYWKRKLDSITNEYKKWREISRKQIKSTSDGLTQIENSTVVGSSRCVSTFSNSSSNFNLNQSATDYNQYNETNQIGYQNNNSLNNQFDYINNNSTNFYSSNDTNFNHLMNNNNNSMSYNIQQNSNFYSQTASYSNVGQSSVMNSSGTNSYHSNAGKQMPFSNRCRSPSPGLFNDVDLFNFSSDTLFSTYCFEDPKDATFGTNPDLFQPDLMHLYPNFGFLDLDLNFNDSAINTTTTSNVNTYNSTTNQTYSQTPATKLNAQLATPTSVQPVANTSPVILTSNVEPTPNIVNATENTLPIYIPQADPNLQTKSTINSMNAVQTNMPQVVNAKSQQQLPPQAQQQQQTAYITNDSSDLHNFNTLVTAAVARSPNMENRSGKNNAFKQNLSGKNLKTINSGKLSSALSQMNSSEPKVVPIDNTKNSYIDNSIIMSQNNNNATNNNNTGTINSLSRLNSLNGSQQNATFNGPSNTIRNLLASQTPVLAISNEKPIVNSNLRLSTGVLSAVGGSLQSNNSMSGRQTYNSTINNLISNIQKQSSSSSSTSSPASSISSPTNVLPTFMDQKYPSDSNQQMSALLTVITAPSVENSQKKPSLDQPMPSKSKRGRKSSSSVNIDLMNENTGYERNALNYQAASSHSQTLMRQTTPQKSSSQHMQQQNGPATSFPPKTHNTNLDILKESKDAKSTKFNTTAKHSNKQYEDNKPSFYLQAYPSDNQLCSSSSSRSLIINNGNNDRNSSSNSPIDSPISNQNHYSSTASNMHVNSYGLLNGNQSTDSLNDYNSTQLPRCNSTSNLNYMASSSSSSTASIKPPVLNSDLTQSQRSLSRSNSMNSLNAMNEVSAEQKRRCNIQQGFERLQTLVPSLRDSKNSKASKAAMLQKTSEYIKELQRVRQNRLNDLEVYKREIEQLSEQISECQNELPANGVSVVGNLNKAEKFEQKFKTYIKDRTVDNWRFYLFSFILKPLFDNFIKTLNTSSKEDIERTFHEWQEKYCNLIQLRPIISNCLRNLSKSTSILSDSSKLPEECYTAALTKI